MTKASSNILLLLMVVPGTIAVDVAVHVNVTAFALAHVLLR